VSDAELAERRAQWQPPEPKFERGYGALFSEQITQANEGCDFAFPGPARPKSRSRSRTRCNSIRCNSDVSRRV